MLRLPSLRSLLHLLSSVVSHPLVLSQQHNSRQQQKEQTSEKANGALDLQEKHVRVRKDARVLTSDKPAGRG